MEYRHLGRTGLKVSTLSYGAWVTFQTQLDVKNCMDIMQQCKDAGVNFFDNAEAYAKGEAEILMGQAVKELGWRRSDVVLSTKIFFGGPHRGVNEIGLSRKHIIEGTKASLERMQLEYVDLLYAHRPDPATPIEETVRAFNWCIDHGLAFYWGTSEWSAQQITEAWEVANRLDLIGPSMEQPQYNLFVREKIEKEYVPIYERYGLGTTIWSPLASGILTGKYSGGNKPDGSRLSLPDYTAMADRLKFKEKAEKVDKLIPIAEKIGASVAQLSLAWCAKNPNVSTIITGATKAAQVTDNLKALEFVDKLTPEIMAEIEDVVQSKPAAADRYGR